MNFETIVRSRWTLLEVTPAVQETIRSLHRTVAAQAEPALQRYYETWRDLPGFDAFYRKHAKDIRAPESEYFAALFRGEMDAAYEERLKGIVAVENRTDVGARLHLGAAMVALSLAFEELGRRHRWSGPACASACTAVLRFVMADCINAVHVGQDDLNARLSDRRGTIDRALGDFGEAASHLRGAMGDASGALSRTSVQTAQAVEAALDAAARTGEAADRGSENLVSTAGASAQLVQSVGEVEQLASQSLDAVRLATTSIGFLEREIGELEQAATAIGSVVTLIARIASQTNLLALNATIEAARAGEAGRGFSVVAAEVKSLSGQTAEATRDITAQVGAIQAAAARSSEQLHSIVSVVRKVEEVSAAAAAATSEQALATASIADQARAAADAVRTIRLAADGMRALMQELREAMSGMDEASQRLSSHGETFQTELGRFSERLTAA